MKKKEPKILACLTSHAGRAVRFKPKMIS